MLINFKNGKFNLEEDYGCILLKELLQDEEVKEIFLDKDYDFFIKYIVNWEHTKRTFSLHITEFENLFQEFGYYGANKQIKYLQNKTKEIIKQEFTDSESVEKYFEQNLNVIKNSYLMNNIYLFNNPNLSTNFIKKYYECTQCCENKKCSSKCTEYILANPNIDLNFFYIDNTQPEKYSEYTKCYLTLHPKLNEDNIGQYDNIILWDFLYLNVNFSEKFLKTNTNRINEMFKDLPFYIPKCSYIYERTFSEEFMEFFITKLNWNNGHDEIYYNLSNEFIIKHKNKSQWKFHKNKYIKNIPEMADVYYSNEYNLLYYKAFQNYIVKNKHIFKKKLRIDKDEEIDLKFIDENIEIFDMAYICLNKYITVKFLEKYEQIFSSECWENICSNKYIPEYFFEKYLNKLNWPAITLNDNISINFICKYESKIIWEKIHIRDHKILGFDFYKKYQKSIDWDKLSIRNKFDNFNILDLNIDRINWLYLSRFYPFSKDELKKYKNRIFPNQLILNPFRYYHKIDYKNHYLSKYLN